MSESFCPRCGTIFDAPTGNELKCTYCSFVREIQEAETIEVKTVSAPSQKQAWLVELGKNSVAATDDQPQTVKHATIEEPCPKCGNPEMYFYTMQLRSVDEGSTVFYECTNKECGNKFSVNN